MRWLAILLLLYPLAAMSEGERAGRFDYYVLALSWSPSWCAREGDARASPQCDPDADYGWVLHGLWPQYETGWPSYCPTSERNPSRSETAAMADITGTAGLAWHAWNKHGRCSGLSSKEYYTAARQAFAGVGKPPVLRQLTRAIRLPAHVIEDAFLEANPNLRGDMITVTCKAGRIEEVRICLDTNFEPRRCGADVRRDCSLTDALLDPIR